MAERFVVVGVGAIGGTIAARLALAGRDVVGVARGEHANAIAADGLVLATPSAEHRVDLPLVRDVGDVRWGPHDMVLLCVKGQDTEGVLDGLRHEDVPVVCLQNGVENERRALRRHPRVYGGLVVLPASHTTPGRVEAYSEPCTGVIDIGRWPSGMDESAETTVSHLNAATFDSRAVADIGRWKFAKLIMSTGNAVEAVCGPDSHGGRLGQMARAEAIACFAAGGIDVTPDTDFAARTGVVGRSGVIPGAPRPGSSTTQSLLRGRSVEVDELSGEVVLLGRLHGVPTPVNWTLQRYVARMSRDGIAPGSVSEADLLRELAAPPT